MTYPGSLMQDCEAAMKCRCSLESSPSFKVCGKPFKTFEDSDAPINVCGNIGDDGLACEHSEECHEPKEPTFLPAAEMVSEPDIAKELAEALNATSKMLQTFTGPDDGLARYIINQNDGLLAKYRSLQK